MRQRKTISRSINEADALPLREFKPDVDQTLCLIKVCAAMCLFAVYDKRGVAPHTVTNGLEKAFHRGGIDNLEDYTAAVGLDSLTHPIGQVGIFFLKVLRDGRFELFFVDSLARADLLPDDFAVLAVKELRRGIREKLYEDRFILN